jgi:hypothetical protein
MKEDMILGILAQESLKSELWLKRYGEKSFGTYLEFLKVARAISGNIFRFQGCCLEFY